MKTLNKFQNILKKVLTNDSANGIMSTVEAVGKQSLTTDKPNKKL